MNDELRQMVLNVRRDKPDVYIGRASGKWPASKWGNPFPLNDRTTRREVVLRYAKWLQRQPELLLAIPELKDKTVGCWCAPLLCHGHVLASLASSDDPDKELARIIAELQAPQSDA